MLLLEYLFLHRAAFKNMHRWLSLACVIREELAGVELLVNDAIFRLICFNEIRNVSCSDLH